MTPPLKIAVPVFPGSNCDHDVYHALTAVLGLDAAFVWHKEASLAGFRAVVIPGGFACGDYLRAGAMAKLSPVMGAVRRFAEAGGPVIGIGNGFQVLLEAGLLPGAMIANDSLKFICDFINVSVETSSTPFTCGVPPKTVLKLPIAHYRGKYHADRETLARLEEGGQVVFRYCDASGAVSPAANPDGSAANIAGICSASRNILGMMPHPERSTEIAMGSDDGRRLFTSMIDWARG